MVTGLSKRNFAIVAAVVIALCGAWYLGSPRWTLRQMKTAAEAGDTEKLATYIDFPALRASMKEELKAHMAVEMAKPSDDGLGSLGAMLAMNIIDPMVDGMITPAAMRKVFVRDKDKGPEGMTSVDAAREDITIDRTGFDTFRLAGGKAAVGSGGLSFTRDGLGWKLTGIRLPDAKVE